VAVTECTIHGRSWYTHHLDTRVYHRSDKPYQTDSTELHTLTNAPEHLVVAQSGLDMDTVSRKYCRGSTIYAQVYLPGAQN
jgi:hypothetical protein